MTTQGLTWNEQWLAEGFEKGHHVGLREGRQEGRREGRQEGRRKGEAAILLRQLKLKYGPLPRKIQLRVQQADDAHLLRWADRVLTAPSLAEVFAD